MKPPSRLEPILADVRKRAAERRVGLPLRDLQSTVRPAPERRQRFVQALRAPGLSIIAECKRSSPSAGTIAADTDLLPRAQAYAEGGAAALSVLTEQDHFSGDPADLTAVRPTGLPRLRKDFLLDEGMVWESVAMGADAVLLLVCCLDREDLARLRVLAGELGLAVLVEAHDRREVEVAASVQPDCLGVNARDLRTFEVDLSVVERLLPQVPEHCIRVAESGLHELADLKRVQSAGADAALVGEALMRAPDPAATLRTWNDSLNPRT